MDIQQIRYFIALSQEMHFHRAADKVHVTQPTLSQGIKKLEIEIGAPLFERSPQSVRLTTAGEKFLPYAISALDHLRKGVDAIQDNAKEIVGTIKLGVIPTICPYLMPQALIHMRQKAPKLKIELYEEKTTSIMEQLAKGQLDLGVLALPINDRNITHYAIGKEPFYLAVSHKHALANKKRIRMKDVTQERLLILQEGHCFGDQSIEYCKLHRNDPQVVFQGSSLTSVIKLAAAGDGVTFVPKMAIKAMPESSVKYIPLTQPIPERELGVIWRATSTLNKAQTFCKDAIRKSYLQTQKK